MVQQLLAIWSTDEYYFDESIALKNSSFIGLAINKDNQNELTVQRVKKR